MHVWLDFNWLAPYSVWLRQRNTMKLSKVLLLQPGVLVRRCIFVLSLALAFGIGYLHKLSGLAYEFHVMFILPVLIAAGFVGSCAGYALALLSAVVWLVTDRILAGEQAELFPLLFNTSMRLVIFLGVAWLLGEMRRVLQRESQLAREDVLTHCPTAANFMSVARAPLRRLNDSPHHSRWCSSISTNPRRSTISRGMKSATNC